MQEDASQSQESFTFRLWLLGGCVLVAVLVLLVAAPRAWDYFYMGPENTSSVETELEEPAPETGGVEAGTLSAAQPRTAAPAPARPGTLRPPAEGIYHAAFANFGATEEVVTEEKIIEFKEIVGKDIVWGYFSNNWFGGITFPAEDVQVLHEHGVVPFVRLMPRSRFQHGGVDPVYTLQKIIDGEFDGELRAWARQARDTSIPLLVEFGTEVNGDWFAWSGASNGGGTTNGYGDPNEPDGPERFRDAYRHIIDLFRAEGAHNITWFFHVNLSSAPDREWNAPKNYYPGDSYIDWVGISVYGAQYSSDPWRSLSSLMERHFADIETITTQKPIAILEFGVVERSGEDKAAWIRDALGVIQSGTYPRIKAVSYWHSRWTNADGSVSNMRIDSSPQSLEAYREMIDHPIFVTVPRFSAP